MSDDHRIVALDTETTGLVVRKGARIIEVGCVELINRRLTGSTFHFRCNPKSAATKWEPGTIDIHGINPEDVLDLPTFAEQAAGLVEYIDGADMLFFNAEFDIEFLDKEMDMTGRSRFDKLAGNVIDVLKMARKAYPGQKNNLNAVCERLKIDISHRELHGAIKDARLTALVWLGLTRGTDDLFKTEVKKQEIKRIDRTAVEPLVVIKATPEEELAHIEFMLWLSTKPDPLLERKKQ